MMMFMWVQDHIIFLQNYDCDRNISVGDKKELIVFLYSNSSKEGFRTLIDDFNFTSGIYLYRDD